MNELILTVFLIAVKCLSNNITKYAPKYAAFRRDTIVEAFQCAIIRNGNMIARRKPPFRNPKRWF